jgi:hypothetical protein
MACLVIRDGKPWEVNPHRGIPCTLGNPFNRGKIPLLMFRQQRGWEGTQYINKYIGAIKKSTTDNSNIFHKIVVSILEYKLFHFSGSLVLILK